MSGNCLTLTATTATNEFLEVVGKLACWRCHKFVTNLSLLTCFILSTAEALNILEFAINTWEIT